MVSRTTMKGPDMRVFEVIPDQSDLPMLLTVEQAARELSIGRNSMFELIRTGQIRSILVGPQMRRIPREALTEYVVRLQMEQGEAEGVA
jgi:excisionase family DNA binding protein